MERTAQHPKNRRRGRRGKRRRKLLSESRHRTWVAAFAVSWYNEIERSVRKMPKWTIKLKRWSEFEATVEAETQEAAEDQVLLRAPGNPADWRVVDAVEVTDGAHRSAAETTEKGAISFL